MPTERSVVLKRWTAICNGVFFYLFYYLFIISEPHMPPAEEQQEVPPGMAFRYKYFLFLFCLM